MKRKKVALVLGGGVSLGYAHIGVLRVLEKYNIPIDMIVGTSMGALIGGAYTAGMTVAEIEEAARKFKLIHFLDVNFDIRGIFSGKGVMKKINKYLPDINIEDMPKPFACVATDLVTEKQVTLKLGSLREAVRASMSIPGIFVPVVKDDMVLIDGGILNNLPEDVAVEMGADIIISCDVLTKCRTGRSPKNMVTSLVSAFNLSTKEIQKFKSLHYDVLIQPDTSKCTQIDFTQKGAERLIHQGEVEAEKHIEEILKLIENK